MALCVVAAVKLAVLGSLGIDLWQELAEQDMLPVPSALAAQSAKSGKAAKPVPADPDAPADLAAPLAEALGEGGMLAESAIPQPKVGESREAGAANRREAELAAKERALTAMEKSIDDKLAEMKRVEASIKKLLDEADSLKDARIKRQVDTYQAMKAKQAAEVLSNMDQDLAVKILTGMKPKVAGEIMTYIKTDKAAKLTEAMTKIQAPMQGPAQ
ncbi:Flagellar motility protein MotE, a chaperone for MotC folding [Humidesulfovibrio mexicanus]|uniref:Flagellar motility protein MotE, a chaperone for MotC folding n=1 Tax=Humidesulfovibrio mexicanus TaxID=147047 RepID=A0A239CUQ9_9BACT|nr:Flagellar motility protein MotE, a chaperone for MotC folding [Humidesulfovibrio mexicanus]